MKKGFEPVRKGKGIGCNRFAPPVAISCGERGKNVWLACEYLVSTVERKAFSDQLLLQWEVVMAVANLHHPQLGMLSEA